MCRGGCQCGQAHGAILERCRFGLPVLPAQVPRSPVLHLGKAMDAPGEAKLHSPPSPLSGVTPNDVVLGRLVYRVHGQSQTILPTR